jgi:dihydrofolate reductase
MRSVIVQEFVSLDGLAAGPNDSVVFVPAATAGDQGFGMRQLDFIDAIDAILLGRVTYSMFAAYWPNVTTGEDRPFADRINAIPKIVFSRTLDRAPWGGFNDATIVRHDAAKEIALLKQRPGKDMVIWGSVALVQSLTKTGLIDEYQLIVCPVVLGAGKPLFRAGDALGMRLLSTQAFERGTVCLSYAAERRKA